MKRGTYGSGSIEQRGPNRFRLTHYVGGRRQRQWVNGARSDANRRLRELTARADAGEHVPSSRTTLKTWAAEWLALLARGEASGMRRKGRVTPRTRERYRELLASYVFPTLGDRPIQKLTPTEIDHLYIALERKLSAATVRHVHTALKACLATAVRKGVLVNNPAGRADAPRKIDPEIGRALSVEGVTRLLAGFAGTVYHSIVATAVMTGARLSELLALRWSDVNFTAHTITISRAIERTKEFRHGRQGAEIMAGEADHRDRPGTNCYPQGPAHPASTFTRRSLGAGSGESGRRPVACRDVGLSLR